MKFLITMILCLSIPIKERFEEVEYWEEKMAEVKKKITRSTSDKEEKTMDRSIS